MTTTTTRTPRWLSDPVHGVDHQTSDEQSHLLADRATPRAGRDVRRRAGLAPRRPGRAVETRPPRHRRRSGRPPLPGTEDAFLRLIETGWDAEAARRPHGQRTTVIVHVDVEDRVAALHLGPLLSDADRRYLTCDATCEVWFAPRRPPHRRRAQHPHRRPAARRRWSTGTAAAQSRAAGPPAACTPTTSGTGRTAAPPNWPTWCCSAPITTGCTTAAASPSPAPPTGSSSPTAPAGS